MKNEEKKIDQQSESSDKKRSNSIGGVFKTLGKGIINTGKKIGKWTKEGLEKIQDSIDFKKEFNKETHEFKIEGTTESFRGFKDPQDNTIYFRVQDEKIPKIVKSNSILVRASDDLRLIVVSVETKKVQNGFLTVNGEEVPVSLFAIYTKVYEKEKITTVVNNVTQHMSISDSTIQGNVQQNSDITIKLNDFENQLRAFKPGLFNKSQYTEAVKIYGDVKDSIINGQKESSVMSRFLDLLGKLSGTLLAAFTAIIQ